MIYFNFKFQVTIHNFEGSGTRNFKQLGISLPQGRAERNEHMPAHLLAYLCPAQISHSYIGQDSTHGELSLPTLVNLIRQSPTDIPTGQPNADNPSLRPFP